MNTMTVKELRKEELEIVAGGGFYESVYVDENTYRAGISFKSCVFTRDEYWIGSTRISKELAGLLRERSKDIWMRKYSQSGDLVGFIREWKQILKSDYGIEWDGKTGTRSVGF